MDALNTPVLILAFNRPNETKRVFDVIRLIRPKFLYIACDGPRINRPEEIDLCKQTRAIFQDIEWPCEVKKLYREKNMGCGPAVSEAIGWFFNEVDEGIILEDDCLPDLTFFTFCEALLSYYRNDESIMHIGGANFQQNNPRNDGSYYFSMYAHVWGWASWKRAWKKYDYRLNGINSVDELNLSYYTDNKKLQSLWKRIFKLMKNGLINTWDYQWALSIYKNKGLSIVPNVNLVKNIGNITGTHLNQANDSWVMGIPLQKINEIKHPSDKNINHEADNFYYDKALKSNRTFAQRVKNRLLEITNLFKTGC